MVTTTTITKCKKFNTHQFPLVLGILQVVFLIIFWIWSEHKAVVLPPREIKAVALTNVATDYQTQAMYTGKIFVVYLNILLNKYRL